MDAKSTVQIINGDVFYSPNSARDITLPDAGEGSNLREALRNGDITSENLQNPRWWSPQTEWLAFVPRLPVPFTGALLETLSFIPRRMFYHEQQGFMMPPYLSNQWLVLDEVLAKVTKELELKHALRYWRPCPPYHFCYHKGHQSQRQARTQAVIGRDWFGTWIGLLYWMIRKVPDPTHIEGITPAIWFQQAVQLGINQAILDFLRVAPLLHRHWVTERVGVILPYPENANQPSVPSFISSGVPVWYRWGPREIAASTNVPNFPLERPPEWQLQKATTWLTREPSTRVAAEPPFVPTSLPPVPTSEFPSFVPPSPPPFEPTTEFSFFTPASPPAEVPEGGIPQPKTACEILEEFFRERKAEHARRKKKETPTSRQSRKDRQKKPSTVKARVYVWDWDIDIPGLFKRTLVRKADREATLADFGSKQKLYDPFFNEWNCSDELEPDPESDNEAEFAADDMWKAGITNLETAFLEGSSQVEFSLPPEHSTGIDSQLLETLRLCYGFVPPLPLPDRTPGECSSAERRNTTALIGISGAHQDSDLFKKPIARLCVQFLRHFWQIPPIKPPTESWDLHLSNRLYIATSLRVHTIRVVTSSEGERLFMFDFANLSTVPWKLAVHSVSLAFLICRLPNSLVDERDIAIYLLEHGIKFRTLRPLKDLKFAPQERHEPVPTRIRVATDQFFTADFEFYEQDAAAFLKQRHGRAALLEGSLLWRIAKDTLSFSQALEGPVMRYSGHLAMFSAVDENGNEYVDDQLTKDEKDLLCGLYNKFTGYGTQLTKASWFPLVDAWERSGLNRLSWTPQNEEWYMKRVASVTAGGSTLSKPLGFKTWRDTIRGFGDVQKRTQAQLESWSQEELKKYITAMNE